MLLNAGRSILVILQLLIKVKQIVLDIHKKNCLFVLDYIFGDNVVRFVVFVFTGVWVCVRPKLIFFLGDGDGDFFLSFLWKQQLCLKYVKGDDEVGGKCV